MSSSDDGKKVNQHFVCTHAQARVLIEGQNQFYIGMCGCRERQGGCSRSRMDVCLMFNRDFPGSGTGKRTASREEAMALLTEAGDKGLVTRPFRDVEHPDKLDGICFCCPECCYYFQHPEEPCDKGSLRESTQKELCSGCGICVESCHFGARQVVDGRLVVYRDRCYGCGLCVEACSSGCIEMK